MPQAAICGIESTTGSFVDSQSVSLIGTQLGVKPAPTPLYFSTFEDDIVGQLPSGFVNPNPTYGGYVQSNEAIGSKSVEFNYNTTSQEQGSRDSIDFGDAPRNPEFYISTWMYYDKTDTTSTQWQIKTIVLGSDDSVYFYFSNNLNQTSLGLQQWWRESNGGQWFNNFASMWYNGVGDQGADGGTLASDAFPFNEWHRVDIWAKMSSAPLQPDAIMKVARKNKVTPLCDITDGVSHDTNNDLWRGIGIGQLVASNFDGLLKLDVLYDNL